MTSSIWPMAVSSSGGGSRSRDHCAERRVGKGRHGGVHEELGDVGESLAQAFGEKYLEKLVLECSVVLFVPGLGLLALVTSG